MIKFKITKGQKIVICILIILSTGAFYKKNIDKKDVKEGNHIFLNTLLEDGTYEEKLNYLSKDFSDDIVVLGTKKAPISVVEYYSYNCSYCRQFNTEVMPKLKENYINNGLVNFAYRPVYDRKNLVLGSALKCINNHEDRKIINEKFFSIEKKDLNNFKDYFDIIIKDNNIENIENFDECIKSKRIVNEIIYNQNKNVEILQLNEGVPVFIIDGTVHRGYMSYEELKVILDNIIASKENKDVSKN